MLVAEEAVETRVLKRLGKSIREIGCSTSRATWCDAICGARVAALRARSATEQARPLQALHR
jgi:hypothetical protein